MSQSSSDRPDDETGRAALPDTERHRLLSSERRRILLDVLEERPSPIDLEELALLVARREDGVDSGEPADVDRAAISLHHHHLPKLADAGVVEYQPGSKHVETHRGLLR